MVTYSAFEYKDDNIDMYATCMYNTYVTFKLKSFPSSVAFHSLIIQIEQHLRD